MRIFKIFALSVLCIALVFSFAFAAKQTPEERGKALFNDPKFAGGQKSCNECHKDGKGLESAADKKEFKIMGKTQKSIEEAVNFCIVEANKGKAIKANSKEMKEMAAYIKSLKKAEAKPETKPQSKPSAPAYK